MIDQREDVRPVTQVEPPRPETREPTLREQVARNPGRAAGTGIALIALGVVLLIANLTESALLGVMVLPTIGVIFLAWGLVARTPGLLVPGGILTGLGMGTFIQQIFDANLTGEMRGGVVVLGLGLGFLLIMPMTRLVSDKVPIWPVYPGGILSIIGVALLIGGPGLSALELIGKVWPVALLVIGAYLVYRYFRPGRPAH